MRNTHSYSPSLNVEVSGSQSRSSSLSTSSTLRAQSASGTFQDSLEDFISESLQDKEVRDIQNTCSYFSLTSSPSLPESPSPMFEYSAQIESEQNQYSPKVDILDIKILKKNTRVKKEKM